MPRIASPPAPTGVRTETHDTVTLARTGPGRAGPPSGRPKQPATSPFFLGARCEVARPLTPFRSVQLSGGMRQSWRWVASANPGTPQRANCWSSVWIVMAGLRVAIACSCRTHIVRSGSRSSWFSRNSSGLWASMSKAPRTRGGNSDRFAVTLTSARPRGHVGPPPRRDDRPDPAGRALPTEAPIPERRHRRTPHSVPRRDVWLARQRQFRVDEASV